MDSDKDAKHEAFSLTNKANGLQFLLTMKVLPSNYLNIGSICYVHIMNMKGLMFTRVGIVIAYMINFMYRTQHRQKREQNNHVHTYNILNATRAQDSRMFYILHKHDIILDNSSVIRVQSLHLSTVAPFLLPSFSPPPPLPVFSLLLSLDQTLYPLYKTKPNAHW